MDEGVKFWLGLDIGQSADPSALVVLEERQKLLKGADPFLSAPVGHYSIRHLQRWPLGTPYQQVTADVVRLMNRPPLSPVAPKDPLGATLVVDYTGVGRPIVEDLRAALPRRKVVAITISGSQMLKPNRVSGGWTVPKKDLAGVIQLCFGQGRLKSIKSKAAEQLVKELRTFTIKVKQSGNESYEALASKDHDDLVLACALPLWVADCGEGPTPSLRVYRLGGAGKGPPLQIYVCSAAEMASWADPRRMLLFVLGDPSPAGEGVMSAERRSEGRDEGGALNQGVGGGDRGSSPLPAGGMPAGMHETGRRGSLAHALPNVLETKVLRFLDASPGDFQDCWGTPLEPWGKLPVELLASARDGKLIWSSVVKRRDPVAECMVFCEEGEGDARAFSAALAVCDVLGLKREETLVRTANRDVIVKKGDAPPNRHVYETIKAGRSLVI